MLETPQFEVLHFQYFRVTFLEQIRAYRIRK